MNVAGGEDASAFKVVLARLQRCLGAGNHGALQVGVALHLDLKAVLTGLDARLRAHAGKVAAELLLGTLVLMPPLRTTVAGPLALLLVAATTCVIGVMTWAPCVVPVALLAAPGV